MWCRHTGTCNPSDRAIRSTCMHLLPLVEMFCKWELQDDCSNLRALMQRFDSEAELQTHELGRSLLLMLRDDEIGLEIPPASTSCAAVANPFDAIRTRLAAVDTAFQNLQAQVLLVLDFHRKCSISEVRLMVLDTTCRLVSRSRMQLQFQCKILFLDILCGFSVGAIVAQPPCCRLNSEWFWSVACNIFPLNSGCCLGLQLAFSPHCICHCRFQLFVDATSICHRVFGVPDRVTLCLYDMDLASWRQWMLGC